MKLEIRQAEQCDEDLLWEFLAIAAHETSVLSARTTPIVASHLVGWKRPEDFGWIAQSISPEAGALPVGAAWARQFTPEEAPFFRVNGRTPELSIAVLPQYQGGGIGRHLITCMIATARERSLGLSLNVRENNPAMNLYKKMGFSPISSSRRANRTGGFSVAMVLEDAGTQNIKM